MQKSYDIIDKISILYNMMMCFKPAGSYADFEEWFYHLASSENITALQPYFSYILG